MIHSYGEELTEKILIRKTSSDGRIVVLFPVTRVAEVNQQNWKRALEIVENSKITALVVLDKTPNGEATKYFSNAPELRDTKLFILRRSPEEQTYDSMAYIAIEMGLWILAFHDDDHWKGILDIPISAKGMELYTTNFTFKHTEEETDINWKESPPARINFTLLPSAVWNRFTEYIEAQGGHVGGSSDATLDLISRLACTQFHVSTFDYIYDNEHWQNRKVGSKMLTRLAEHDGWNRLAGVDIQLINRTLDNLSAINFFANLYPHLRLSDYDSKLLQPLSLSRKRNILLFLRNFIAHGITQILNLVARIYQPDILTEWISRLTGIYEADALVIKMSKMSSRFQLQMLIKQLRESAEFPKLEQRFIFWEKYLTTPRED